MVHLYFVRHGQTLYNIRHKVQGWCDSPLTEKGLKQAEEAGRQLSETSFVCAFSGDLNRQRQTAEIILSRNVCSRIPKLQLNSDLREIHYGSFETKNEACMLGPIFQKFQIPYGNFEEFFSRIGYADVTDFVAENDPSHQAENHRQALGRILNALENMTRQAICMGGGNVLVVSSGGIMGMLFHYLFSGQMAKKKTAIIENASITVVQFHSNRYYLLQ